MRRNGNSDPSRRGGADPAGRRGGRRRRGGGREGGEQSMVPRAEFQSYYGRPVLKPPVWEWKVPAYLFTGGLSAGAAVLAAGADLTGRPELRRWSRIGSLAGLGASTYLLVADLGRPERFHHMLRVAKPTSPMSVGTWILAVYGPFSGLAAVTELLPPPVRRALPEWLPTWTGRLSGLVAAGVAPALASYTAVLLSQTAVPAWQEARAYLPFVFTGSAAASGGGLGMICAPVAEAGPARAFAAAGAATELASSQLLERRIGMVGEAYHTEKARRWQLASDGLTAAGLLGVLGARRSRTIAVASGLALLAVSVCKRFGTFAAGVESTKDPKYVVVPQRERLARKEAAAKA
jgi:hypothetical protein